MVRDVSKVKVLLLSSEESYARIIAVDPYRDLGLLRIRARNLHPLELGDSSNVEVGELVFAIGSPLGLP